MSGDGAGRQPRSMAELAATLASGLPGAARVSSGNRTEWSRGGTLFAVLDGEAIEVRLDDPVAGAALKTPDTMPSGRGMPWVRFAPATLDDHAVDRATAWFQLAWRRAAPS